VGPLQLKKDPAFEEDHLKEQLKRLEELQRYDARLQEYEAAMKALPEKLASLKADLAKVETLLEKDRSVLQETEKFRGDQEFQIQTDEANIAKAKTKLAGVKSGKEYMAAQREMESGRRTLENRQEEIKRLADALTTSRERIAANEGDVNGLRELVAKEEAQVAGRIAEIQSKIGAEREARDQVAKNIDANVLKRYSAIRMKRGLAVVPVVRGTCKGCHMSIPPQLYITLQRGSSIETCPTCNRIIYWDEIMKDAQLEAGEK
jgi:predicted  nucleic acid-binding Zn-ribbon protein